MKKLVMTIIALSVGQIFGALGPNDSFKFNSVGPNRALSQTMVVRPDYHQKLDELTDTYNQDAAELARKNAQDQ
jgi:hypothetical protein